MFERMKKWMDNAPVATFDAFALYSNQEIEKVAGPDRGRYSLAGVTVELEDGSEFRKRVTLTRFAAIGLFALAVKKKRGGEKFLLISGPEFAWAVEVRRDRVDAARKFAARVKAAAAAAAVREAG